MKAAGTETVRHRAAAMVEAGARLQREMLDLSRAANALSRAERSIESASAGRAISDGQTYPKLRLLSNSDLTGRAGERLEKERTPLSAAGLPANLRIASSVRGVIPPTNVSRRDFAPPSSRGVSNDGSGRASITINSSPTVVINAPMSGALQQDVIGALRAHREELFDQLKRESARRERAQF